jgi:hypothetical protein
MSMGQVPPLILALSGASYKQLRVGFGHHQDWWGGWQFAHLYSNETHDNGSSATSNFGFI